MGDECRGGVTSEGAEAFHGESAVRAAAAEGWLQPPEARTPAALERLGCFFEGAGAGVAGPGEDIKRLAAVMPLGCGEDGCCSQ